MKLKVGIIDYGIGNWESIKNILSKLGFRAIISENFKKLDNCDLCLLPGVGAFRPAMKALEDRGLNEFIFDHVKKKKTINWNLFRDAIVWSIIFRKSIH